MPFFNKNKVRKIKLMLTNKHTHTHTHTHTFHVSFISKVFSTDLDDVSQNLFTGGSHVIPLYVLILAQNTIPMKEICISPSAIHSETMFQHRAFMSIFCPAIDC
jgi:hypothetical protein